MKVLNETTYVVSGNVVPPPQKLEIVPLMIHGYRHLVLRAGVKRFLVWLGLRAAPPVPLHMTPWAGRIIYFGVALGASSHDDRRDSRCYPDS